MPFDPQLQQAIAAHMQYLRDLGIFDFYRRSHPQFADETAEDEPVSSHPPHRSPSFPHASPSLCSRPSVRLLLRPAVPKRCARSSTKSATVPVVRSARGRNKIVFGDGDPNARLMFVGEGPGADEDAQGLPFVGRAGQLLNNMIAATGLKREQVYIANIVKCRPPQNRVPEPEEANTCSPFLFQQIDVIRPEVLVALGSTAATYLLGVKSSLSGLRGRIHACRGTKLVVTYHPAYLLRDPRQKKEAWQDLKLAMAELGLSVPSR